MFTAELAHAFARLPLAGLQREYPHADVHVSNGTHDIRSPRELHPAFYGCFDWHSAVHGHWTLVRILRSFDILGARDALHQTLTPENIAAEVAYMEAPNRGSFERMYGWAWLLALAAELRGWDDVDARTWATALRPLEDLIVRRYLDFLPRQTYPIRVGTHANTAFGLALAYDYALAVGHDDLRDLIAERADEYFGADSDYPAHLEPGGADFLSPCLIEADLMRRILPQDEFDAWWSRLLPHGLPPSLRDPALVADRTDGQIGHLDGLNLSRAWCLRGIASSLTVPADLDEVAHRHAQAALPHVTSGNYMGDHWLATFAVYLLT